jgi:hypothetical protein
MKNNFWVVDKHIAVYIQHIGSIRHQSRDSRLYMAETVQNKKEITIRRDSFRKQLKYYMDYELL